MKKYDELNDKSKVAAVEVALVRLVERIADGRASFPGRTELTAKIKAAGERAEKLRTPWFYGSIVYETCKVELTEIAELDARRAFYREPDDLVLMLG